MRMEIPRDVPGALRVLEETGGTVLAGGTDLVPDWTAADRREATVVWIGEIPALREIREEGGLLSIGAAATHTQVAESPLVRERCPLLAGACAQVGSTQIRNQGTLGGNVVTASPAADSLPALEVSGVRLVLASAAGERTCTLDEFITGPGETTLRPGELLVRVLVEPARPGERWFYHKTGLRRALSVSLATVAIRAVVDGGVFSDLRIALGAVGPRVLRADGLARRLCGRPCSREEIWQESACLDEVVCAITDVRACREYRDKATRMLVYQGLSGMLPGPALERWAQAAEERR